MTLLLNQILFMLIL